MIGQAPVRVAQVDLADPIRDIDCIRPDGSLYGAAWILVRHGGRPLGNLLLEVADGKVSAESLRDAIASTFPASPSLRSLSSALPRVSVIVPTAMTRGEQLQACITSLDALDYPDYEVIVVDNRRGEHLPIDLAGVSVVRERRPGLSAARNAGLAEATGDIIAYTDDDVEVDSNWLRAITAPFVEDPRTAIVTGSVLPYELETDAQLWFEEYYGALLGREYAPVRFERTGLFAIKRTALTTGAERVYSIYKTDELGIGANMALRASVLRDLGGFDLALGAGTPSGAGEETAVFIELLMKRHALVFEPSAIVWHKHRDTFTALEQQTYSYGVGMTAMFAALLLHKPVHFLGLALVLPAWLRLRLNPGSGLDAVVDEDPFRASLDQRRRNGLVRGPLTYLRGTWMQRRWRSAPAPATPVDGAQ